MLRSEQILLHPQSGGADQGQLLGVECFQRVMVFGVAEVIYLELRLSRHGVARLRLTPLTASILVSLVRFDHNNPFARSVKIKTLNLVTKDKSLIDSSSSASVLNGVRGEWH